MEATCKSKVLTPDELDKKGVSIQPTKHRTRNICTRFETTQIISLRSLQLALNDPPLVDPTGSTDCLEIAVRELKQGKLGKLVVRRYFPDGSQEDWRVEELRQIHS